MDFMRAKEDRETFEHYVERFQLCRCSIGVQVTSVEPKPRGQATASRQANVSLEARNVVVATGMFQRPKIPAFSANLPAHITSCIRPVPQSAGSAAGRGAGGGQRAIRLPDR